MNYRPEVQYIRVKDSMAQVHISIESTFDRCRLPTGIYVQANKWDAASRKLIGSDKKTMKINNILHSIIKKLDDLHLDMLFEEPQAVSAKALMKKYKFNNHKKVVEYILEEIIPSTKSTSSRNGYDILADRIRRFDKEINFVDINTHWIMKFHHYLTKMGLKRNSVNVYMARLKATLNHAERNNVVKYNPHPFSAVVLRKETPEVHYLTKEEVERLEAYRTTDLSKKLAVDFWLAMYYAHGSRFGDALNFQWDDIKGDVLTYRMAKVANSSTTPTVKIPIHDKLRSLIEQYRGHGKSKFIFPLLPYNASITFNKERFDKEKGRISTRIRKQWDGIAEELGFEKLNAHMARRSFANHVRDAGADLYSIKGLMNHSSEAVTQMYLRGEDKRILPVLDAVYG